MKRPSFLVRASVLALTGILLTTLTWIVLGPGIASAQFTAPLTDPTDRDAMLAQALDLNEQALELHGAGKFDKAIPLTERALAIWEKVLGPEHPETAVSLSKLAFLYQATGRFAEAEPLFARALELREKVLGPEHPDTANSLHNLAALYEATGRYAEAEPLYTRALAIYEKALGPEHPSTATSLNNLAFVYEATGRSAEAEPLYARALAIWEKVLGPEHPSTATSLNNLAFVYEATGRSAESFAVGAKSSRIETVNLRRMLNYFTETECLAYAAAQQPYNLAGTLGSGPLAAASQLGQKGLVMEAIGFRRRLEASLAGNEVGTALLRERDQLAPGYQKLLLEQGEAAEATVALKKRIDELDKQINLHLQGASGAVLTLVPSAVELAEVQKPLPQGVRLLEGFRYDHKLKDNAGWEQRYAWTVIGPESAGEPVFVSLGAAEPIDAAIAAFRASLESGGDVRGAAETLYRLLWEPLEKAGALGTEVTTVVISGDSQLHFVPFAALIRPGDGAARFLCQDYAIRYVNSGRDLVAKVPPQPYGAPQALLVGNPAFARGAILAPLLASVENAGSVGRNLKRGMDRDSEGLFFGPLPGAEAETAQLKELLGASGYGITSLDGGRATEPAFRAAIDHPRILHMATHGFFLQEPEEEAESPGAPGRRGAGRGIFVKATGEDAIRPYDLARVQDPMLRSGLALAGAQDTIDAWQKGQSPEPEDDGLLLAAEAATLDLRGTGLLVTSACSTAEGKTMDGEGVMGLRRALAVAGAQTVVMSLWPVDDHATVELMGRFYRAYLGGQHPAAALDEVIRDLLVEHAKTEGVSEAIRHYAPFIATSLGPVVPGDPK